MRFDALRVICYSVVLTREHDGSTSAVNEQVLTTLNPEGNRWPDSETDEPFVMEMKVGEVLNYDFELLITPFKLIDKNIKFNDRYFHGGGVNAVAKPEMAIKAGANIINIHHAEDIYPFINYPYLDANVPELQALVNGAHKKCC